MIHIVSYGQTIWDVALQRYGDELGVFMLIEDNPGVLATVNDDIYPGLKLKIRVDAEINKEIVNTYLTVKQQPIVVNTGLGETTYNEPIDSGGVEGDPPIIIIDQEGGKNDSLVNYPLINDGRNV